MEIQNGRGKNRNNRNVNLIYERTTSHVTNKVSRPRFLPRPVDQQDRLIR